MPNRAREPERLLTADAFGRLPEDPEGYRYELVRGRVVREPPPKPVHGRLEVELAVHLATFVKRNGLGVVLSNTGFVVATDPDTVRGPDLAFVATARIPRDGYAGQYWRLGPDLAVEILSPSNSESDIQRKVIEYLGAGSRTVWVIDPKRRSAAVHRSPRDVRVLSPGDDLEGDDVLSGFRLPVAELFR